MGELAALLAISLSAFAYLLGERRGLVASRKAKDTQIAALQSENRALSNRLMLKEGSSPVFDEKGNIIITPPGYSDSPVLAIMRPPFAQAEYDWEKEEEANRPPAMSDLTPQFVPELSEEEKERLKNQYS